jgi:hypothetical protein
MHTDAIASNVYFGWYRNEFADLGPFLADNRARRPAAKGPWHPEQCQALHHETAWPQLEAAPCQRVSISSMFGPSWPVDWILTEFVVPLLSGVEMAICW